MNPSLLSNSQTPAIVGNGLQAFYPMEESIGSNAHDFSGKNNNGALIGSPAWATSGHGRGAIQLNGTQYATLGHPTIYNLGSNDYSFSVWFKMNTTSVPYMVVSCDNSATDGRQFLFSLNDNSFNGSIHFAQFQSDTVYAQYKTNDNAIAASIWYHVVIVKSGNTAGALSCYLNGSPITFSLESENDFPNTMQTTTSDIQIGARQYSGFPNYLDGSLTGLRFYNRALTASEIALLYNETI
jgi:hypothetical protein